MLVDKKLSQEIYDEAGYNRVERAKEYIKQSRVEIIKTFYEDKDNFEISGKVEGNFDDYNTKISVLKGELENLSCECLDYQQRYGACKHIVATLMKFEQTKFWEKEYSKAEKGKREEKKDDIQFANFRKLVNTLYNEDLYDVDDNNTKNLDLDKKVRIEPKIICDRFKKNLKLEIKIGVSRMYKIKDLAEFYTRMSEKEFYKYGDKLEFVHVRENFTEDSQDLLDFVLRYGEIFKYSENTNGYRYLANTMNHSNIVLASNSLDEAFDILKNKKVLFNGQVFNYLQFVEQDPDINFELIEAKKDRYKIKLNREIFNIQIYQGRKYTYILDNEKLYRCTKEFENTTIKFINMFKDMFVLELDLEKEDLKDLYSVIMPKLGDGIKLKNIDEREFEKYKPKKLGVKIYLDFDENNYVVASVKFCYGEEEFNPLEKNINIENTRNMLEENKNLNILRKTGFMVDMKNLRFVLPNEEQIFNFLENDIEEYMQRFEVLATDNFKSKEIKRPKLGTIGIKVENDLLSIDLSKINVDTQELQNIMKKYKLKKRYYRLKDGGFLSLEKNSDINFLDDLITGMNLEYKDLDKDVISLPVNRSIYLNELLQRRQFINVTKNKEFRDIVENVEQDNINDEIKVPQSMEGILRDYQKIGFKWLKVLDSYRFGGILADDMGLGKTLQILAVITDYIQSEKKNRKTSIVVAPSSLALNWLAETKKFAPEINTKVIKGTVLERKRLISNIESYDLVITSYDLLKRDIKLYQEKNYVFKYIIADEAQYMKNSATQNSKAIKSLNADVRFALTGTPIENSLSELWSIFDFIMPGYLFSYRKFKDLYETPIVKEKDELAMNKLKMLISPFILRRNKKDVLTELPEKTITVLNNQMTKEQEEIYMSYLVQIKEDVANEINASGFEKSQIKILAGLTRLRQICCHPKLFIENYKGRSSKLDQCMDIIEGAIEAGHKILLFSVYTAMFEIIQDELIKRKIKFFKLTGSTKIDERIDLVDEFNSNPEIKVFLISLKAGGTGLNLTGADVVIHYDPWWNQAAENQATDRAYRIGQKNNVQVYKLITSNSIEDKIYELQQQKASLIDNMLDVNMSFINKFSKDEIMSLFE